jgi:hypothetical protein
MSYDIRLVPAVFFAFIVIVFLLICIYHNFIEREYVHENTIIKNRQSENDGRLVNVYKRGFDSDGNDILEQYDNAVFGKIKTPIHDEVDYIYINGQTLLSDNLNNKVSIQLAGENIYTITLPKLNHCGMILNIWNSSNMTKNLKSSNLNKIFILNNNECQFVTLNPGSIITIENNGKDWIGIKVKNFLINNILS